MIISAWFKPSQLSFLWHYLSIGPTGNYPTTSYRLEDQWGLQAIGWAVRQETQRSEAPAKAELPPEHRWSWRHGDDLGDDNDDRYKDFFLSFLSVKKLKISQICDIFKIWQRNKPDKMSTWNLDIFCEILSCHSLITRRLWILSNFSSDIACVECGWNSLSHI